MTVKAIVHRYWQDEERGFKYNLAPLEDTITIKETADGYAVGYLVQDESADSPDRFSDDSIFLVHYHRDMWVPSERMTDDVLRAWYLGEESEEVSKIERDYWIFPVAAYIHSGVVLSLGNGRGFPDYRWDVSHVGAVFASKGEWQDEKKAEEAAEQLITSWNEYLAGDVYCIVIEIYDKEKKSIDYDIVGGYSGLRYALGELAERMTEPPLIFSVAGYVPGPMSR